MNLKKLSNKALIRYIQELREMMDEAMDIPIKMQSDSAFHEAEQKYHEAGTELRRRIDETSIDYKQN